MREFLRCSAFGVLLCAGMAALLVPDSFALLLTPGLPYALRLEPYYAIGYEGQVYEDVALANGYTLLRRPIDFDHTYSPAYTVTDYAYDLDSGYGLFMQSSHGGTRGISIEVYEPTPAGLASRDSKFLYYHDTQAFKTDANSDAEIYTFDDPGVGYVIGVYDTLITRRFNARGARTLLYDSHCSGAHMVDAYLHPHSGNGAEAVAAWEDVCPIWAVPISYTFRGLNGEFGTIRRRLSDAIWLGPFYNSLHVYGNGDMCIAPTVEAVDFSSGATIDDTAHPVTVTFDSKMAGDALGVYADSCVSSYNFTVTEPRWANDHQLTFKLTPKYRGLGDIRILAYKFLPLQTNPDLTMRAQSDGGIALDGDFEGPNRDDFIIQARNTTGAADPNAAARILAFSAVEESSGVSVDWRVQFEQNTQEYLVQHGPSWADSFATFAYVPADSQWAYHVHDSTVANVYRLLEVESTGDTLVLGIDETCPPFTLTLPDTLTADYADSLQSEQEATYSSPAVELDRPIEWICLTKAGFVDAARPLADFWSACGHPATVVNVDTLGSKTAIRTFLSGLASQGLKYVLLAGDASDSDCWLNNSLWVNGWKRPTYALNLPWPAQSQYNLLPMWSYTVDPAPSPETSMSWYTPYWSSDWGYVDFDADSLPDIALGRAPVRTAAEMTLFAQKTMNAARQAWSGGNLDHAGLWVYAHNWEHGDGLEVISQADVASWRFPSQMTVDRLQTSDAAPIEHTTRESQATNAINAGRSMIVALGTSSARSGIVRWLDQYWDFQWSKTSALSVYPFLLGSSCDIADLDMTEDPALGRPLLERAVLDPTHGPWGGFGPSRAGWTLGHGEMADEFLHGLYQTPVSSVGEAARLAVRKIATERPQSRELALSYGFIGDPLCPSPRMRVPDLLVDGQAPTSASASSNVSVTAVPSGGSGYITYGWKYRNGSGTWSSSAPGIQRSYTMGTTDLGLIVTAQSGNLSASDTMCVELASSDTIPTSPLIAGVRTRDCNQVSTWTASASAGRVCGQYRYEWRVRPSYSPNYSAVIGTHDTLSFHTNESFVLKCSIWGKSATAAVDTHYVAVANCGGCPTVEVWTENGWERENTILGRTLAGQAMTDGLRITHTPKLESGRYRFRIVEDGRERSVIDGLRFLTADHSSEEGVYTIGDSAIFGVAEPVARVTSSSGVDLTEALTGSGAYVAAAGETLYVQRYGDAMRQQLSVQSVPGRRLNPGGGFGDDDGDKDGGSGFRTMLPYELASYRSAVDAASLNSTGYLVQVPDSAGNWTTVQHRYPRAEMSSYVQDVDGAPLMRLVMIGQHRLAHLSNIVTSARPDFVTDAPVEVALHSRSGDVKSRLRWIDGVSIAVEPGDTLALEVNPRDSLLADQRSLVLAVRGYYTDFGSGLQSSASDLGQFVNLLGLGRPNPVRQKVEIEFQLRRAGAASLNVYDPAGRLVRTVTSGVLEPGPHSVLWDGKDDHGRQVRSGVYFYRLETDSWHAERKLVLIN